MDRHGVLIVGAGSIGERHVRCFQATGRAEVALCEVRQDLRQEVAERYRLQRSYAGLDEALNDASMSYDVGVIATPAPLHVPMASQCAQAGIHVLIEKPLSTGLGGVEELQRLAAKQAIVAGVAYVYRAHPALQAMREAIDADRFGRPVQAVAVAGQHFPTYRPAYQDTYYARHESGGGTVQDALTHVVNAVEFLVGPVDRVLADTAHLVLDGVDVEDTANVLARHGSVVASYSMNQHQAPNESTITVICERGAARFELHNSCWMSLTKPGNAWHRETTWTMERDSLFGRQAGAFLDAVEGKAAPLCSLAEGVQTLRVNLAVLAAAAQTPWRIIESGKGHMP